ncbi:MAG: hypothetical protein JOY53_00555 [Acidobacteriaceae bacterium]|nr:hypothetical protein [Acidobacteriaceae bacterium]
MATLNADETKILQDPGGWEYITISDADNGIQTKHTCFDGQPHPNECSGTLILNANNTFVEKVHIHGKTVERHGGYQLNGDEITFVDELGTSDGPYTMEVNTQTKRLVLQIKQAAGTLVRSELELETEYKKQKQARSKPQ